MARAFGACREAAVKAVVLAAGYATRLYPLTRDVPKSLLEVGGRTILDRLLDNVGHIAHLREVVVVSNARFFDHFERHCLKSRRTFTIRVLNDGSTTHEQRLGAVADLALAIEQADIREDCLVLAGDNIFTFELADFVAFFHRVGADCIAVHELDDLEQLRRTGVVEVDEASRVLSFAEKPDAPRSTLAAPPLYVYQHTTLPLVGRYLGEGHPTDAPGSFIPWLLHHRPVYAFRFRGQRYDIGDRASYAAARRVFQATENR